MRPFRRHGHRPRELPVAGARLSGELRLLVDLERSLRHDPLYALRLLADVAIRALSPAVNDPTTAVRSVDEIEGVLRVAAYRPFGPVELRRGAGTVVLALPSWDDVCDLALLEREKRELYVGSVRDEPYPVHIVWGDDEPALMPARAEACATLQRVDRGSVDEERGRHPSSSRFCSYPALTMS